MRRREVLRLLGGLALTQPASGQTAGRRYRVAVLAQAARSHEGFRSFVLPELGKRGFVEGANLDVTFRAGGLSELPGLAEAAVAEAPDAVFAVATPTALAARQSTATIPIVLFGGEDAVSEGLAGTLSKPGGNVTGVVILSTSLNPKRMELLREAVPGARRIGVLLFSGSPVVAELESDIRAAAASAGVDLTVELAGGREDYPRAFGRFEATGVEALVIGAGAQFFADAEVLIDLARRARLPTACEWSSMAHQGCLVGYGPRREELYRIAARKLTEVLQGIPPSTIPIERPTFFDLAVNLKTAAALGLAIPPTLLARADEVIE